MEKLEADNTVTYTINLDDAAALFIYENLKHKKLIKCVYGILRHICKAIIPCYLIFTTHTWNKCNSKLRIYSKCMYHEDGCKKYNFYLNLKNPNIIVKIVTNTKYLKHPIKKLESLKLEGQREMFQNII